MMNKRTSYFFALTVVAALVAAGCATGPGVEIMMDPNAPVTEAPPVYAAGSSWTFDHTVNGETQRHITTIVEKTGNRRTPGRRAHSISSKQGPRRYM